MWDDVGMCGGHSRLADVRTGKEKGVGVRIDVEGANEGFKASNIFVGWALVGRMTWHRAFVVGAMLPVSDKPAGTLKSVGE